MKNSNIVIALIIVLFTSCSGNHSNEHGHEHSNEQVHEHSGEENQKHHEQEEFTISDDSVKTEEPSHHTHEDGSEHHSH